MNRSKLSGMLAAGGMLLASGSASAVTLCGTLTTLSQWSTAGSCTDEDLDMQYTFGSAGGSLAGITGSTGLSISEVQTTQGDYYTVHLTWAGGYVPNGTAGTLNYTVASLDPTQPLSSAAIDSTVSGTGGGPSTTYTSALTANATNFLNMTSLNGNPDPLGGSEYAFGGLGAISVANTYNSTGGATFNSAINQFNVVPEPESLFLLIPGLAGIALRKRTRFWANGQAFAA